VEPGRITPKQIFRTFSDGATALRNGMISGCYPLEKDYSAKPEFSRLKAVKQ
jgi:NADPH2 dehydrogenase